MLAEQSCNAWLLDPSVVIYVMQAGQLYDDVVVKLPIAIQYGEEAEWDVEERERMLGEEFVFGCGEEDGENDEDENNTAAPIIDNVGEVEVNGEVITNEEDDVEQTEIVEGTKGPWQ